MKKKAPTPFKRNWKNRRFVVANRTSAVIYREDEAGRFVFVKRLVNPRGRRMESELDSDRPGRNSSSAANGTIHHALDDRKARHEGAAIRFAGRIAAYLERSRPDEGFTEIVLVAEPHFLGLMNAALPRPLKRLVKVEVPREYAQGSDREIQRLIEAAAARKTAGQRGDLTRSK